MNNKETKRMDKQCGSCAHANRFLAVQDGSGVLDRVECASRDHAKWLDRQNLTTAFSSEIERLGYVNLWRLERVARRDYGCPHWRSKEAKPAIEGERRRRDYG